MRDFPVSAFKHGVVNAIEAQSIPDGAASNSLNWLTKGDKIELRRGSKVIGTEIPGVGRITGIHVGFMANGTAVAFGTHGQSVFYLNNTTDLWVEVGTNILGSAADGEDVFFANYATNAGNQVWLNSPNGTLIKIMTANPGDYANMYDGSKNFKGYISINNNRMNLWYRTSDFTGFYGSYIDTGNYTTVSGEATASLGGTLAFKGGGSKRTCFGVVITLTGTGEVYTDDYNGNLTGSLGGTGTINYMTGAYTLSNPGVGTTSYQWEDSTNQGIADFSKSATRLAGQGFVFRQDDGGGPMQNVAVLGPTMYCFHELRTWALTLTATDTNATNDIFRQNVGIPYRRAMVSSSIGIFYIDNTDQSKPLFRKLSLNDRGEVIPKTVTENLDLSSFNFDRCAMWEWNDYILWSGRTNDSTVNNRLFAYHKTWGSVDILDHSVSCMAQFNGTLIAGEAITNNFVTLFSGFDDSDATIPNYWEGNVSELLIPGRLKKTRRQISEGEIQVSQILEIYYELDRGGFELAATIRGDGTYVDTGAAVHVGANTIGSRVVGGGGDGIEAFHYQKQTRLRLGKYQNRKIRLVATGIGYVSVTKLTDHDVLLFQTKIPRRYRT